MATKTSQELRQEIARLKTENKVLKMALRDEVRETSAHIAKLEKRADSLAKLDRQAATYVEGPICMRTHFTGDKPYVGWKGLGRAMEEVFDERDRLKKQLATALHALDLYAALQVNSDSARTERLIEANRATLKAYKEIGKELGQIRKAYTIGSPLEVVLPTRR